jgi:predicted site-specific integrase-resolvase
VIHRLEISFQKRLSISALASTENQQLTGSGLIVPQTTVYGTISRDSLLSSANTEHMNIAIYSRVSTKDKGQDVENQLRQLREFCAKLAAPGRAIKSIIYRVSGSGTSL